jgi:hypothetical protein
VIVNANGDVIVRPSHLEQTLRRGASSVEQHLMSTYGRSLVAIMRAQFTEKGGGGGSVLAVQSLLRQPYVHDIQRLSKLTAAERRWAESAHRPAAGRSRPPGATLDWVEGEQKQHGSDAGGAGGDIEEGAGSSPVPASPKGR